MEPDAFISKVRDHYVDQFKAFVARQRESCTEGAAEVRLRLSDDSEVYQHLYCADFVKKDDGGKVVELQPARLLEFDTLSGSFGDAALEIEQLRWDDVVVHHDAAEPLQGLPQWFERWFDPDDQRYAEGSDLGNVIHSLLVQPGTVSTDLGSAEPDALWEMLDLIEAAGATRLRVTASRTDDTES